MKRTKLYWLRKLAKSTNYIVVTDNEAVINVRQVNPESFHSLQQLSAQRSTLVMYKMQLDKIVKDFDKHIDLLMAPPTGNNKKTTKIPVKKG